MPQDLLMFVDDKMYGHSVCETKHREGAKCNRQYHAIPHRGVLWFGRVDNTDDFWNDLAYQRHAYRLRLGKWQRELNWLKNRRHAPAFAAYIKNLIEKHKQQKPAMAFIPEKKQYRER